MRILAPVDSPEEVTLLASIGAEELYGGYLPEGWLERFALDAPPSWRSYAESYILGKDRLTAAVAAAHGAGVRFFLAVNSPFYASVQQDALCGMVEEALAAGVDALIVADIGLILEARSRWPGVSLHLSSVAEAGNSAAAAFFRDLGVARISLPRHLTLEQIRTIVEFTPGVEFGAFALFGQCPNAEGVCTFSHDHPRGIWPCVQRFRLGAHTTASAQAIAPAVRGQGAWGGLNRADACGLCALPDLAEMGIESVQIVGRGVATNRKQWAVRTLRSLLNTLGKGTMTADGLRRVAHRMALERFGRACDPRLCYFPELIPDGSA